MIDKNCISCYNETVLELFAIWPHEQLIGLSIAEVIVCFSIPYMLTVAASFVRVFRLIRMPAACYLMLGFLHMVGG